ncbi:carbon storage regulator [Pseudomonas sp. 32A]|uniref:carbon storage regulator n=1 Tax=Pseudomonas sp. 32A TaxID=651185 RepID=UPI00404659E4
MQVLVITRTPNELLRVGEEIQIKVIKVDGDIVSVGITAPKDMSITRSERRSRNLDDDAAKTSHPFDSVGHI